MKKILKHYRPFMIRPIIQQMLYRLLATAIVLLAAARYGTWNANATIMGDGLFLAALVFLAGAWFNYLFLDEVHIKLPKRRKSLKQVSDENKYRGKNMADYIDTDLVNFSELSDEQRAVIKFFAYLIPGIVMLVISLIVMFF